MYCDVSQSFSKEYARCTSRTHPEHLCCETVFRTRISLSGVRPYLRLRLMVAVFKSFQVVLPCRDACSATTLSFASEPRHLQLYIAVDSCCGAVAFSLIVFVTSASFMSLQPQLPHSGPLTSSTVPIRLPLPAPAPPPPPLGPEPSPPSLPPPNNPPPLFPAPDLPAAVVPVLPAGCLPGPLVLNLLLCAAVYESNDSKETKYSPRKL